MTGTSQLSGALAAEAQEEVGVDTDGAAAEEAGQALAGTRNQDTYSRLQA